MGGLFDGSNTGAILGGIAAGPIGAVVGYGIDSGNRAAQAAGDAAAAQLAQQNADRRSALGYAGPSDMELQQLDQAIQTNTQDIARKQKLLDSADPALIEAGKQALQLMQGKEASTLAPLKNQLSQQRQALQNSLAQQLGPDYANSSAGIQALNSFDQQAANTIANQQDQTLMQFLGVTQNTEAAGNMSSNIQANLGITNAGGAISGRQVSAIEGTPVNPSLGYAGQLASANQGIAYGNQVLGLGATLGAAYLTGGGSAAAQGAQAAPSTMFSSPMYSPGAYTNNNYQMPTFGAVK